MPQKKHQAFTGGEKGAIPHTLRGGQKIRSLYCMYCQRRKYSTLLLTCTGWNIWLWHLLVTSISPGCSKSWGFPEPGNPSFLPNRRHAFLQGTAARLVHCLPISSSYRQNLQRHNLYKLQQAKLPETSSHRQNCHRPTPTGKTSTARPTPAGKTSPNQLLQKKKEQEKNSTDQLPQAKTPELTYKSSYTSLNSVRFSHFQHWNLL